MSCQPTRCRYLSRASHLVAALSPQGSIERIDSHRPNALGYDAGDFQGRPLTDFVAPGQREHVARLLRRCETGQPVWDDLTFVSADGGQEAMLVCFQPLPADGGPLLLLTGLRRETIEGQARAEAAVVLGHLAFQCHRPAHRLMQAVEALREENAFSPVADECRTELDALLEAMSCAAAWPASDARRTQPTDVVAVLEAALRRLDADPSFANVEIDLCPDESAMWAAAHPVGLACVALHLAANARDATAKAGKPHLSINVYRRGERIVVEFTDNGSGLACEDARCAFSPFFKKGSGQAGGCGTGLATCCELVHYMGGTIRMQSRRSRGTTVFLTFPSSRPPH